VVVGKEKKVFVHVQGCGDAGMHAIPILYSCNAADQHGGGVR
jgi:hypothetical protein